MNDSRTSTNSFKHLAIAFLWLGFGLVQIVVGVLCLSGANTSTVKMLLVKFSGSDHWLFAWLPWIVMSVAGGVLIPTGVSGFNRARRNFAVTGESAVLRDLRPPVLYLRSFKDDSLSGRAAGHASPFGVGVATEEEQLANVLKDIGPGVAFGMPGEKLPYIGMARKYVSREEDWKDVVRKLLSEARLVLIRAGSTEGVIWEIENAFELLKPEQLVFLLPFDKNDDAATGSGKQDSYQYFRQVVDKQLSERAPTKALPSTFNGRRILGTSLSGLIYFQADWTPCVVALETVAPVGSLGGTKVLQQFLRTALLPVFDQLGVEWKAEWTYFDRLVDRLG